MSLNQKSVTRSAGLLGLWTLVSRILGFVRDLASARLFGAGWISDAYYYAFRIPNLLRDLLAEGALSSAFVPAMAREQELHGREAAWKLCSGMLSSLLMVLSLILALGLFATPQIVALIAPGFKSRPEQFELTLTLTRIMMPFIAFMALGALFMGALNAFGRFLPGAIAPSFMNLAMIAAWLGLGLFAPGADPLEAVRVWAWASLIGGFLQMAVQLPSLFKLGFRPGLAWPFSGQAVRRVWRQMGPAVLASSTTQINLVVNSVLASFLAAGSATYLYAGNRLMQFPQGIFGVSIATALLPTLARSHASGDAAAFKKDLGYGLRLTLFVALPSALGLALLAKPIHVLLFQGGRFTFDDAIASSNVSVMYSLGIVFTAFVKVLSPAFYARESGAVAARVSLGVVVLNLALNLILVGPLGYLGLALSTSLCALVQAGLLLGLMRAKLGSMVRAEILADIRKVGLCLLAMAGALLAARAWLDRGLNETQALARGRLAWELPLLIGGACLAYFGTARALGLGLWAAILGKQPQKA